MNDDQKYTTDSPLTVQQLSEKELLFTDSLYSHLPIGIEIYDKEGRLYKINKRATLIYGLENNNNIIGKLNIFEHPLLTEEIKNNIINGIEFVIDLEYNFDLIKGKEYYKTNKSGTIFVNIKMVAVHDADNQIKGYIIISNDVTETVRLNKSNEELLAKCDLAMRVSNISHWDFDVHTQLFTAYNDPVNDFSQQTQLTHQDYLNIIHPEDISAAQDNIQDMLRGVDQELFLSVRMKTKYDNHWQNFHITCIPFKKDKFGKVIGYTGFKQNFSQLYQLNEQLIDRNNKMNLVIKTIGMSHWDFDVETKQFYSYNDPVNSYDSTLVVTKEDYLAMAHPDDQKIVEESIESMAQGKDITIGVSYRSKTKWDNDWQTLLVTGIPTKKNKQGKVIRYTGLEYNNTKWENMAQELRSMKEKAELSDRLKSNFLANMSHEIRTPLNAIVGFSELLKNCDNEEEKEEYMNIISANNDLLLRLINDILDLSKIESGILERKREWYNVSDVCLEVYSTMQSRINTSEIDFIVDNPLPNLDVFLDKNRFKQVWINYLTNAIKCTSKGFIKMGYNYENGGIRIYVTDSGIGIPKEKHQYIFNRFQKLNDFAQGTGLGLAISKAITEAALGEVGFESTYGVGSTFWAWLPCQINELVINATCSDEHTLSQDSLQYTPTHINEVTKILIVEDNDSNYLLVQHILKTYQLTRAINGAEAVDKVYNNSYDVVLMDIKMPVMDGIEATQHIRKFNPSIPIIALTANVFDSDKVSALEAGCNAFLTKPLKKAELIEALSNLF